MPSALLLLSPTIPFSLMWPCNVSMGSKSYEFVLYHLCSTPSHLQRLARCGMRMFKIYLDLTLTLSHLELPIVNVILCLLSNIISENSGVALALRHGCYFPSASLFRIRSRLSTPCLSPASSQELPPSPALPGPPKLSKHDGSPEPCTQEEARCLVRRSRRAFSRP